MAHGQQRQERFGQQEPGGLPRPPHPEKHQHAGEEQEIQDPEEPLPPGTRHHQVARIVIPRIRIQQHEREDAPRQDQG
jgi:hypothetical protein